jgi:hypothetical protein
MPSAGSNAESILEGPFRHVWGEQVGPVDPTGLASFGSIGSDSRPATNVYVREFEKGVVAVNVGGTDVSAASVPGGLREIQLDGTYGNPLSAAGVPASISLSKYSAKFFTKS